MKFKKLYMKILVWNMKWMTRYLSFIARPIVQLKADSEVIACGLKSNKGISIIYSPSKDHKNHTVLRKNNRLHTVKNKVSKNFSGNLVHNIILPKAKTGEVYIVKAIKKNKKITSPTITIKKKTDYPTDLIKIKSLSNGKAQISWKIAEKYDSMIYFLVVEDNKKTLSGIYTRESSWTYPLVKKASLSLIKNPLPLQYNRNYTVKLAVVDYDGWVDCVAEQRFNY